MDKGSHYLADGKAGGWKGVSIGVARREERASRLFGQDARVMELMATKPRTGTAERPPLRECHFPIAEMAPLSREACLERQKPGHGMAPPRRIDEAVTQHHIAAAFTIKGDTGRRRCLEPVKEAAIGCKAPGVKLGIAAGKEDRIGSLGGRLI